MVYLVALEEEELVVEEKVLDDPINVDQLIDGLEDVVQLNRFAEHLRFHHSYERGGVPVVDLDMVQSLV